MLCVHPDVHTAKPGWEFVDLFRPYLFRSFHLQKTQIYKNKYIQFDQQSTNRIMLFVHHCVHNDVQIDNMKKERKKETERKEIQLL